MSPHFVGIGLRLQVREVAPHILGLRHGRAQELVRQDCPGGMLGELSDRWLDRVWALQLGYVDLREAIARLHRCFVLLDELRWLL